MKTRGKYLDKFQLLNKSEQELFWKLKEAAPSLIVFSQVSMSQVFYIRDFHKKGFLQVGEIGRKSIDFLLCRQDTSIVLAVELNGPKHDDEKQQISDEKKSAALEEAGIPLVIFKPGGIPDVKEIRSQLAPYIVERHKSEKQKQEFIAARKNTG